MKRCNKCKKEKNIGLFHKNRSSSDGHQRWCKDCLNDHIYDRLYGGNRNTVLERDGYECQMCGLGYDEQLKRYGRGLAIDHIDGCGIKVSLDKRNNDIDNLWTLCSRCHGKKEIINSHISKGEQYSEYTAYLFGMNRETLGNK